QWLAPLASSPAGITVSDYQYFLGGNAGASAYAVNRLDSNGSLRAQAADSSSAGNNICAEYYPNSGGTTLAPLYLDTILGLEFQGSTGNISFFTKDPVAYADTQRDTKSGSLTIMDTSKFWAANVMAGKTLSILTGANAGQSKTIA